MSKDTPQSHSFGMGKPNASNQASAQISGKQIQNHVPVNGQPIGAQMQPVYYRDQNGNVAYMQQQTIDEKQLKKMRNRKPKSFWIAIAVAVLCIILVCVLIFTMAGGGKGTRQGVQGQLDGKTQEEIQAELDRAVEEGMFNISIASTVQFADGESEGELRIENVPGNHYLMRVEITRDDTGDVIYTTDFIEPNHHIQSDTLDVDLPAGEYDCTATFFAYDEETEELIGQAAAKVDVGVLG